MSGPCSAPDFCMVDTLGNGATYLGEVRRILDWHSREIDRRRAADKTIAIDINPPRTNTSVVLRVRFDCESAAMRFFFLPLLVLGFIAQQFVCCCGSACAVETSHHCESTSDHHCCHDHGDHSTDEEGDHEHHFCVGSHLFFLHTETQLIDLSSAPCVTLIFADILKSLSQPVRFIGSENSSGRLTSQQRRALLCIYCI